MTLPLEHEIPEASEWPGFVIPIAKFDRCLPFHMVPFYCTKSEEKEEVTAVLEDNSEVQDRFIAAGHLLEEIGCKACAYDGADECEECGGVIHKMFDTDEEDLSVDMGFEPPVMIRWCDGECGLIEEV